jgi:hypothetical protein
MRERQEGLCKGMGPGGDILLKLNVFSHDKSVF